MDAVTQENLMTIRYLLLALTMAFFTAYSMEKGPLGLTNIGSSCFINATLQSLFSMEKLTDLLLEYEPMYKEESFTRTYTTLAKENKQKRMINPDGLELFCLQGWNLLHSHPYTQQDAGELLQTVLQHISYFDMRNDILNTLPLDVNKQPITELSELYSIKTSSQIQIPSLGVKKKKKYESSVTLTLPLLPNDTNLKESLTRFFLPEPVEFAYKGNKVGDAQKVIRIEELGTYVIIHLKKTSYSSLGELIKNENPISFPLENLSFAQYFSEKSKNKGPYNLKAFIVHLGKKGRSGHYTAYVRYGSQWYACNDSSITPVTENTVETIAQLGYSSDKAVVPTTFVYELNLDTSSPKRPHVRQPIPTQPQLKKVESTSGSSDQNPFYQHQSPFGAATTQQNYPSYTPTKQSLSEKLSVYAYTPQEVVPELNQPHGQAISPFTTASAQQTYQPSCPYSTF